VAEKTMIECHGKLVLYPTVSQSRCQPW